MTRRALIAVASKHGATMGIGAAVGRSLISGGVSVEVSDAEDVSSVTPFDIVIVGSAVYAGRWMLEGRHFIERFAPDLRGREVWLFSSGPIGDPPKPDTDPVDVADYIEQTGAAGHMTFAGKLDKRSLSLPERAITTALRAPYGDFRDWDAIADWASGIVADVTVDHP